MASGRDIVYDIIMHEAMKQLADRLGLTKMQAEADSDGNLLELRFYNCKPKPITVVYDKDLMKTIKNVKQAFVDSHEFDEHLERLDDFTALLSESINDLKKEILARAQTANRKKGKGSNSRQQQSEDGEEEEEKSAYEKAQEAKVGRCRANIKRMKEENIGISLEAWMDGLKSRYDKMREVVDENIPEIWPALVFELSSLRILNIYGCTLPFIGIILARPSSHKTVALTLLKPWKDAFYTDNFSPKAWITHTTSAASEEKLSKIDMLPKIKNQHFLTPELAPIFTTDEKDLAPILGTITRIADGHGLATDSGTWGHREYGDTMFVWTGAAVDVPYKVYKLLGNLGSKIYFFRLPYIEKTEEQLLNSMTGTFNEKKANIQSALFEYLTWFEIGPTLIHDDEQDQGQGQDALCKMLWDYKKDSQQPARIWIARLAILLSRLRCIAQIYNFKNDVGQGSDYGSRRWGSKICIYRHIQS